MSGRLVAREGARTWVVALASEALVLGRAEVAAVRATFAGTSQQHCRLELVQGSWWAVDLNSTNGTFVNGQRVGTARLRSGDRIKLGRCVLGFSLQLAAHSGRR